MPDATASLGEAASPGRLPTVPDLRREHNRLLDLRRDAAHAADFPGQVTGFIQRARASGVVLEDDEERAAVQGFLSYWANVLVRLTDSSDAVPDAILEDFDATRVPRLPDDACPYVGLDAFQESQRELFFGRVAVVEELLRRLRERRLLAVVGLSGSGKSSLVRAGLLPALKRGELPGSDRWRILDPVVPGSRPLSNVARLVAGDDAERVRNELMTDPAALARIMTAGGTEPVVLFVDQFEEMFSLCSDAAERLALIENLRGLATAAQRHLVILTMRSDFKDQLRDLAATSPEFRAMLDQAWLEIPSLGPADIREAIVRPADRVGLRFEAAVVDRLVTEFAGQPAGLPMLQFALRRLWALRRGDRITLKEYEAAGGGLGALAKSAQECFDTLPSEAEQRLMSEVLLKLVYVGDGLEPTRNRARRLDLLAQLPGGAGDVDALLTRMNRAGILRLTEGETPQDVQVEVAHEALLRNWKTLAGWIDDKRLSLRQRGRLTARAKQWEAHGRQPGSEFLMGELQRAEMQGFGFTDLTPLEAEFIAASGRALEEKKAAKRDAEEREREQNRRLADAVKELTEANVKLKAKTRAVKRAAWVAGCLFVLAVALLLGIVRGALYSVSQSRAAQAKSLLAKGKVFDALLVSLDAYRTWASDEARGILLAAVAAANDTYSLTPTDEPVQHEGRSRGMAFSPDGRLLASGREDGSVVLSNVKTKGSHILERDKRAPVYAVVFDPTAPMLAASTEGLILLWDLGRKASRPVRLGDEGLPTVLSLAYAADGKALFASRRDGTIERWDLGSKQRTAWAQLESQALALSVDRDAVIAFAKDGFAYRFTMGLKPNGRGRALSQLSWAASVSVHPGGKSIAAVTGENSVLFWDLDGRTSTSRPAIVPADAPPLGIALGPNGAVALSSATKSGNTVVRFWRAIRQSPDAVEQPGRRVTLTRMMVVSQGGAWFGWLSCDRATASQCMGGGQLWLWEQRDPTEDRTLPGEATAPFTALAFDHGARVLGAGSADGSVRVWKLEATLPAPRKAGWTLPAPRRAQGGRSPVTAIAVTRSEKVAFADEGNRLRTWEPGGAEPRVRLGWDTRIDRLMFTKDETAMILAGSDGRIGVLPLAVPSDVRTLHHQEATISSLALSPDDKTLAWGDVNGGMAVADLADGHVRVVPTRHTNAVAGLAFSSDGMLFSSGWDGKIYAWNLRGHVPTETALVSEDAAVLAVAVDADGTRLLWGAGDQAIVSRAIDVLRLRESPDELEKRACARVRGALGDEAWRKLLATNERPVVCIGGGVLDLFQWLDPLWQMMIRPVKELNVGGRPATGSPSDPE